MSAQAARGGPAGGGGPAGRVLVAGVGNIFLSDDGFGVEAVSRLASLDLPPGVEVGDFGTGGLHLAYQLLEGYEGLVLLDALDLGEEPGTVVVFEPSPPGDPAEAEALDGHTMSPASVLSSLQRLGGSIARVVVVGCQPASLEEGIGLSEPVSGAVGRAAEEAVRVATEMLGRPRLEAQPSSEHQPMEVQT